MYFVRQVAPKQLYYRQFIRCRLRFSVDFYPNCRHTKNSTQYWRCLTAITMFARRYLPLYVQYCILFTDAEMSTCASVGDIFLILSLIDDNV